MTELLERIGRQPGAVAELVPLVYDELRQLAHTRLRHEASFRAPDTTSLVHEVYLRLVRSPSPSWKDRSHFFAAASEAMRRVLVDLARERNAAKRGGGQVVLELRETDSVRDLRADDILAVDHALEQLEGHDAQIANVVKLRFFAGLTVDETAQALELSPRSVNRLWTAGRAWLQREIRRG